MAGISRFGRPPFLRSTPKGPKEAWRVRDAIRLTLCRRLCRNPAIPDGIGQYQFVLLKLWHFAEAAQTLNSIGTLYYSFFLDVASCSTDGRFGVGEVASSNLVVPTINSIIFNKLYAPIRAHFAKMILHVAFYSTHFLATSWFALDCLSGPLEHLSSITARMRGNCAFFVSQL